MEQGDISTKQNCTGDGAQGYEIQTASPPAELCTSCQALNLKHYLSTLSQLQRVPTEGFVLVGELGQQLWSDAAATCALCLFLRETAELSSFIAGDDLELRLFSALATECAFRPDTEALHEDVPAFAISKRARHSTSRKMYCTSPSACNDTTVKFIPLRPQADLSFAQHCLNSCEKYHSSICNQLETREVEASALKLIDCFTLKIEMYEVQVPYFALSYVWSKSQREDEFSAHPSQVVDLDKASKAVQDAVDVTKRLGFRYLWIDRYCINQSNAMEIHTQIAQMDRIYRNATMTIIAAAGLDESAGLPGISDTRKVSPACKFGELHLARGEPDIGSTIRRSCWNKRAWTYQEAVLSKRRLIFTENEMYFECNLMHARESFNINFDTLYQNPHNHSLLLFRPGLFDKVPDYPMDKVNAKMYAYRNMIETYTLKYMTFAADSLNAFLGIAKHMAVRYPRVQHICGLPLSDSGGMDFDSSEQAESFRTSFSASLTWHHPMNPGPEPRASARRGAFPTWAWAGWEGPVSYRRILYNWQTEVLDIHPETAAGQSLSLQTWVQSETHPSAQPWLIVALNLHVKAITAADMAHFYMLEKHKIHLHMTDPAGLSLEDVLGQITHGRYSLILLATNRGSSFHDDQFMVVRRQVDSWTRVGFLEVADHPGNADNCGFRLLSPSRFRLI